MALRHIPVTLAWALACVAAVAQNNALSLVDGGRQVVMGRYSTQSAEPAIAIAEPLDVVVQLSFPRQQIVTIGDAVRHTLLRTGYTLVDPSSMTPEAARFLQLPLPESQRSLGPYRVQAVLDVLLGSTWHWQRDPLQRRMWFTVDPAYAPASNQLAAAPLATGTAPVSPSPAADALAAGVVVSPVASSARSAP